MQQLIDKRSRFWVLEVALKPEDDSVAYRVARWITGALEESDADTEAIVKSLNYDMILTIASSSRLSPEVVFDTVILWVAWNATERLPHMNCLLRFVSLANIDRHKILEMATTPFACESSVLMKKVPRRLQLVTEEYRSASFVHFADSSLREDARYYHPKSLLSSSETWKLPSFSSKKTGVDLIGNTCFDVPRKCDRYHRRNNFVRHVRVSLWKLGKSNPRSCSRTEERNGCTGNSSPSTKLFEARSLVPAKQNIWLHKSCWLRHARIIVHATDPLLQRWIQGMIRFVMSWDGGRFSCE